MSSRWIVLWSAMALACSGSNGGPNDAGGDAGSMDAARADAGSVDAGTVGVDSSPADAGNPADSGTSVCDPATSVADSTALLALLPAAWGRNATRDRPSTGDLQASAAISVTTDMVTAPSDCTAECQPVSFFVDPLLTGVTLSSDGSMVQIASGIAFQMRVNIGGAIPTPLLFPNVTFERPCSAACQADEQRCDVDRACYVRGQTFCSECQQMSDSHCACVGPNGEDLPDTTECFYVTGDIAISGTCMGGECNPG